MLIFQLSLVIPNSSLRLKYDATFALWMMFLLGRHAMFGQEPPTYFRSTTTVFIPFLARVQERSLPAAPLPRMSRSYSSALIADAVLPLVAGLSKCSVVSMSFSCLVIRSAGLHTIKLLQSRNNIIRIKPAGVIHIHVGQANCSVVIHKKCARNGQFSLAARTIGVLKRVSERPIQIQQAFAQLEHDAKLAGNFVADIA